MARKGGLLGGGKMPGGMNQMMKQVQKMQKDMEKMQEEMADKTVDASAGGGAVMVTANGKKEIVSIKLKPEIVDADDIEMLEDLIMSACNEAIRAADEMMSSGMSKITSGLNIPGL